MLKIINIILGRHRYEIDGRIDPAEMFALKFSHDMSYTHYICSLLYQQAKNY